MKTLRSIYSIFLWLTLFAIHAQQTSPCGTGSPGNAWDRWFSEQIQRYMEQVQLGKSSIVSYTIPVIVHVVHNGEAYATYPNIDSTQVYSQIPVLNADFGGIGAGIANCPSSFSTRDRKSTRLNSSH